MVSRQHRKDPLHQQSHWWHRMSISTQKFAVVLTIGAFLSGFSYVMLTNTTAAEGFAIKELQQKIDGLKQQNEKLELKAADLRALSAVDRSSASLQMKPADTFEYLAPTGGSVALGR